MCSGSQASGPVHRRGPPGTVGRSWGKMGPAPDSILGSRSRSLPPFRSLPVPVADLLPRCLHDVAHRRSSRLWPLLRWAQFDDATKTLVFGRARALRRATVGQPDSA